MATNLEKAKRSVQENKEAILGWCIVGSVFVIGFKVGYHHGYTIGGKNAAVATIKTCAEIAPLETWSILKTGKQLGAIVKW